MCPPKPPKVENPAAAPAPAAQGADALKLGGGDPTDDLSRQGVLGRSMLRIGRGRSGSNRIGPGPAKPGAALGIGPGSARAGTSGGGSSLGIGSSYSGGSSGDAPGRLANRADL